MKKSQRQIRKEYKEKGIKTGKERYNIGVTILLILGLVTILFPLYMTVMIDVSGKLFQMPYPRFALYHISVMCQDCLIKDMQ